jgi:aldose 1-epimerase
MNALHSLETAINAAWRDRTPHSAAWHERAQAALVGGVSGTVRFFPPYPAYFEGGHGAHVTDIDGHDYIDCFLCGACLLLGHRAPVTPKANDFNEPRRLGDAIPVLLNNHGDNHFVRRSSKSELARTAILKHSASGLTMTTLTTQDTVQVYSAAILDGTLVGKSGIPYIQHAGLCLECQGCPGAVHTPLLGDIILRPGNRYDHMTIYAFSFA